MTTDWQRFELYLDISDKGFFVVEACEYDIIEKVISSIRQKKEALFVDFSSVDTDYYNEYFDKKKHNCVVFYNLQFQDGAEGIIDSFNMNRDNFAANDIVYIFILSKYLSNYLIIKTPNLHSYVTSRIELCRTYEAPFRPLMSLDNFIIDKSQIREEKLARKGYRTAKKISTYKELFDSIEYYKYNRASSDDLSKILQAATDLYVREDSKAKDELFVSSDDIFEKFYREFVKVAFYQDRLQLSEYAGALALLRLQGSDSSEIPMYDEYFGNVDRQRADVYSGIKYKLADTNLPYTEVLEMIELLRYVAAALFYQKRYMLAFDWFELIHDSLNSYKQKGFHHDNMMCRNLCDMALCMYKITGDHVDDTMMSYFGQALSFRKSNNMDIKTLFVLDYNDLVYKIKRSCVRYEDYLYSECQADYYKKLCSEKSSIFASYLSLVAWIRGCIDGNIIKAVDLNERALLLKRRVLTENHYSIAESQYCSAVLCLMSGDVDGASSCCAKAFKILNVNPEKNHTLIEILERFAKYYNEVLNSMRELDLI